MKWLLVILMAGIAAAVLPACDSGEPPRNAAAPSVPAGPDGAASIPEGPGGRMTEFFFYRAGPGGVEQRPSFVMRTPEVSITVEGEALLEQVEAEIHGRDNEITTIRAERGRFDQQTKTATMEGAVVLEQGTMRVEMEDLVWLDEERMAKTEKPVSIYDEGAALHADNLEFHPDESALLLDNMTGGVELAGRREQ